MALTLVVILSTLFLFVLAKNADKTLVQAHIIFRHGQRTPDPNISYPLDPYKNETFYPYGMGELNQKGKINAYGLGKSLRNRYDGLFGPVYYKHEIEALSSSYSRAQMTLELVLAGLYPPSDDYLIDESLNWQPISFTVLNPEEDKLINTFTRCNLILHKDKKINETTEDLFSFLTYHSGLMVEGTDKLYYIFDTINVEIENGLELPEWIKPIWPEPMRTAAEEFSVDIIDMNLVKQVGNLLEKIVVDTKALITSTKLIKEKKLILYSGHDINILFLLGAFDAFKKDSHPTYLSNIVFEVHLMDEVYGFKLFYQNGLNAELIQIPIPGCGLFCSLQDFEAYVESNFSSGKCI